MSVISKLNKNNLNYNRLKIEFLKNAIDSGIFKGKNDYNKFIILCRSRVGSNLLISYLNSHPAIFVQGELFGNTINGNRLNLRKQEPENYLNKYCFRKYPSYIKAAGFKIFYYHPVHNEPKTIWELLKAMPDLKIIHLKRENILRTHLSKHIAGKTDKWTATNHTVKNFNKTVALNPDECLKAFEETTQWQDDFDQLFDKHQKFEIIYENLISNPDQVLGKTQNFLNVNFHLLKSSLKKQNPEPLNELISNYDELKIHFKNTKWNNFFEI